MATNNSSTFSEIENILTETAEVQLATFNAGIEFWSQWVKHTTKLSQNLEKNLNSFKNKPDKPIDSLLEIVETNREYLREFSNVPKDIAKKFSDEVDRLRSKSNSSKRRTAEKHKRRARAKV